MGTNRQDIPSAPTSIVPFTVPRPSKKTLNVLSSSAESSGARKVHDHRLPRPGCGDGETPGLGVEGPFERRAGRELVAKRRRERPSSSHHASPRPRQSRTGAR